MSGQARPAKRGKLTFLLICDEWSPWHGGVSRFNRGLATAVAKAGFRVLCLVRSATAAEYQEAVARGVELIVAPCTPGGPESLIPVPAILDARPDLVIGHDVISSSIAWTYVKHYVRSARLVCVLHTPHSHNEPYKRPGTATARIETREREIRGAAADADVVAAVGPRLVRWAEAVVGDGFDGTSVVCLEPGMDIPPGHADRRRQVPANRTIMMLGRVEHLEPKGLDIAAGAIAGLAVPRGSPQPELLIRGARSDRCDAIRTELAARYRLARDRIDVRPFTDDIEEIAHDLTRSALCVLPSRVEGFGLAALEAIALGTPVLVSAKSGLAETLSARLGTLAEPMIVAVTDDERDIPRWRTAIQWVMDDLDGRFRYAHEIRDRLASKLSWAATVEALLAALKTTRRSLHVAHPPTPRGCAGLTSLAELPEASHLELSQQS